MSEQIITGIDIGTYQVKVAIARVPKGKGDGERILPEIIGTGFAESRGLKSGYIIQESEVIRSIKSAVVQAEKSAGIIVKKAYVAIGSIGIEEIYSRGEIIPARADSEIISADLEKVMLDSEYRINDNIPNRRILHSIPLRYLVDNSEVLGRPQGMRGTKLEVDSLFITAYEQHVNDMYRVVENIGITVEDIIAAPLAASFVMLSRTQKRAGCVLVNIGAETTSMVVFEDNKPISLKIFPAGSNDVTNDIALGLKVPLEEAEKIKRGGMTSATFSKKRLDEIINHRLSTIFSLINTQLEKIKRDGLLPAGVILTGGGSNSHGITDVAKTALSLPARLATLEIGVNTKVKDASWAVAYGICMWGASSAQESSSIGTVKQVKSGILSWFHQFLP